MCQWNFAIFLLCMCMHACVVYMLMCVQMHILVYAQRPTEACECPVVPVPTIFPWDRLFTQSGAGLAVSRTQAVSFLLSPSLVRLARLQAPGIPLSWPPQCGIASMHPHIQVFTGSKEMEVWHFRLSSEPTVPSSQLPASSHWYLPSFVGQS